jgi:hypothetical protein
MVTALLIAFELTVIVDDPFREYFLTPGVEAAAGDGQAF